MIVRKLLLLLMLAGPAQAQLEYYPLPAEHSAWNYRVKNNAGQSWTKRVVLMSITDQRDGSWDFDFLEKAKGVHTQVSYYLHETGFFLNSQRPNGVSYWPPYPILAANPQEYDEKEKRWIPFVVGKTSRYEGTVTTADDKKSTLVEESVVKGLEPIQVPAGRFQALRIDIFNNATPKVCIRSSWYAKKVGLVKSRSADQVEELESFSIIPQKP